ncbi:hypothetical protein D3C72_769990 [compost metagenome]
MGVKRYVLDEAKSSPARAFAAGQGVGSRSDGGADNRLFVNGVLWVLRSGPLAGSP